jgi:hypothetical protein
MTWPWALNIRSAVSDIGDPYAHAYFLWWDYHQTFHNPLHLFDATIFYPYANSLAFSENDYGISLIFFPILALGARPLMIYNLAVLTSFAFSGYGAFRLTRTLTNSAGMAAISGVIFAFVPYRFQHLSHLPLIFAGWIPLMLEALILFARKRSWACAAWLGFTLVMNALTCLTWAVLTVIPLIVSGLIVMQLSRRWKDKQFWLRAALVMIVSVLALLPLMIVYTRVARDHSFVRSTQVVAAYTAHLINWFAVDRTNRLWHGLNANYAGVEFALFPGFLPMLLSLALTIPFGLYGVISSRFFQTKSNERPASRPLTNFLRSSSFIPAFEIGLTWLVIGFTGSLGMNFFFHRFLYRLIPLFQGVRVATRWAMIGYLGLAILGGLAAGISAKLVGGQPKRSLLIYGIIILALLFEQRAAPLDLAQGAPDPDEISLHLKQTPMRGGIVELPAGAEGLADHEHMLRAADHGRPLVTAISSYVPPITQRVEQFATLSPIPNQLLDLLESIPVSYLVVNDQKLTPQNREDLHRFIAWGVASDRLRYMGSYDRRNDLYAVVKTEPDTKSAGPLPFTSP